MTQPPADIDALLITMADDLRTLLKARQVDNPVMIGIHSGGVWVARRLHEMLGLEESLGTLDISFYRDDFSRTGMHPEVKPSHLPFDVDNRHLILVDDVLYTGRTIRAALNELFDYGRPAAIYLAVLADRDGRELPVQADVTGYHIELPRGQQLKLQGPDPLGLRVVDVVSNA
ncbi:MAG: bifunctional pyr operon transcriptional regulator/uracil phosphoribosyltransferase PyrR [Gammaproteobacteria bacterium]|nr:bifunctional pyr operon transcriptional regulator/uracil phosphoribosyltransferase PyrR [Gammaproteobacteria bacterium]